MTLTAANPPPANADAQAIIAHALAELERNNPNETDGKWLEEITVSAAPHLKDWDIDQAWHWGDLREPESRFPGIGRRDIGIDAVARRSDGGYIAIQCKARQLDESGNGASINKEELDSFVSASAPEIYAERWVITNGNCPFGGNAGPLVSAFDPKRPLKLFNIHADLLKQQEAATEERDPCPHCETTTTPDADGVPPRRARWCMQDEAVSVSVRILREHVESDSGGCPVGEARGRLILPCGTGKTRISLRIIEELTPPGELAIVLCPSIALVSQLRWEYLQNAAAIRALAVCSDASAGYDPNKESSLNTAADPTLDTGHVSAAEIKGKVTTDPAEIADWMQQGRSAPKISVIFGTYQSGHRIAEALRQTGITAQVLVADEAHRTAGLRRRSKDDENAKLRDFTLCHNNEQFPAVYRLYQTATPRIYDTSKVDWSKAEGWIVRTMDDEETFGVELYSKSYQEAVNNGWLSDYRIIAVAVNGPDEHRLANELAGRIQDKGIRSLTSTHFLRGLAFALAMGGGARGDDGNEILPIKSCIAFMNTVAKSKDMAKELQEPDVQEWLQGRLDEQDNGQTAARYSLEHLDATNNVTARDAAKRRLKRANAAQPHGIINVGIFGEGTDSPDLSAVAFLEARKSPIDVVQAVGRAMRTAPGKEVGYIICPIVIPPGANPEQWLSVSGPEDGWQELAQILLALRAHDSRIGDELAKLMRFVLPANPPELVRSLVAIAAGDDKRIVYAEHTGLPGQAEEAVQRVIDGQSSIAKEFQPIDETETALADPDSPPPLEPSQIITGQQHSDGSIEMRRDSVARHKPSADGTPGKVDFKKSKDKAREMINKGRGNRIQPTPPPPSPAPTPDPQPSLPNFDPKIANTITMNLLAKSGLTNNRVARDLNLLEYGIREAAYHLRNDELLPALNRHFRLDNLKAESLQKQADGCTIAALLLMNAMMLHQRIANGQWLTGISGLDEIKNAPKPVQATLRQWQAIIGHDFKPVLDPAVQAIYAIEDTGKLAGLERALHHLAPKPPASPKLMPIWGRTTPGRCLTR